MGEGMPLGAQRGHEAALSPHSAFAMSCFDLKLLCHAFFQIFHILEQWLQLPALFARLFSVKLVGSADIESWHQEHQKLSCVHKSLCLDVPT